MAAIFSNICTCSIRYMGFVLALIVIQSVCDATSKRSISIEDGSFEVVKILPDGSEQVWRVVPNQKIQIPDNVGFCFDNQNGNESIILEKKIGTISFSIEIAPGEKAEVVESKTGDLGLLQKHTDGSISLHLLSKRADLQAIWIPLPTRQD